MNPSRVEKLDSIGFDWTPGKDKLANIGTQARDTESRGSVEDISGNMRNDPVRIKVEKVGPLQ
jgi:hypothetical protein